MCWSLIVDFGVHLTVSNPFERLSCRADGLDLNPLLQTRVVSPPMLTWLCGILRRVFLCVAALLGGTGFGWPLSRPWTLCLCYDVELRGERVVLWLGWVGGGLGPVENAFSCRGGRPALMHSLRPINASSSNPLSVLLAIMAFSLSLLGPS